MKESYTILPIPSGDVSGICSALYELEGMVVIHDPSGCNSTYNTHDELRWYDKESDIFISGLNMRDAVLGNDRKFISDIVEAAKSLKQTPKFIAICNSPVPYLNGTDFEGISRIVEKETGIPTFYVKSNGMHDYIMGVQEAYLSFAKKMLTDNKIGREIDYRGSEKQLLPEKKVNNEALLGVAKKKLVKVNILGATPLDYGNPKAISSLKKMFTDNGFSVNSVWSLDTSFEEIMKTLRADVNLVISSTAIPLAEYFKEQYGMPYVVGAPVTKSLFKLIMNEIELASRKDTISAFKKIPFRELKNENKETISIIIGESVLSSSVAAGIRLRQSDISANNSCAQGPVKSCKSHETIVLCPYPYRSPVMRDYDFYFDGEEELVSALEKIIRENPVSKFEIIADPMYRPMLPNDTVFLSFPTLSISGRRYKNDFINFFEF